MFFAHVSCTERNLFVRERSDGLYYVITYLMAKMSEELLLAAVATLGISACRLGAGSVSTGWREDCALAALAMKMCCFCPSAFSSALLVPAR
jgi:hypothetical protein